MNQTQPSIELRPYQQACVNAIVSEFKSGNRSTMATLATGLGKTVIFSSLAARAKGRVLVLAHRDELIRQAAQKLQASAPSKDVGIVKAKVRDYDRHIVVASVQSLTARHFSDLPGDISLVIVDECHHSGAAGYQAIFQHLKAGQGGGPFLLGVTATPNRADGLGLGSIFNSVAFEYGLFDAIEDGWLSKIRATQIKTGISLKGISTKAGDFAAGELEAAINTTNRNELTVKAWKEHAASRKTVAFTVGVKHAIDLFEAFKAAGVSAAYLCGETPTEERQGLLADLKTGKLQVLCNAAVLTEGFDEPSLECVLLAKPTKSEGLYIQMVGRGTRLHPGKEDCLILDISDNAGRHSLAQLANLEGADKAKKDGVIQIVDPDADHDEEAEAEEEKIGKGIHAKEIDLMKVGKKPKVAPLEWVPVEKSRFFGAKSSDGGVYFLGKSKEGENWSGLAIKFWWANAQQWTVIEWLKIELGDEDEIKAFAQVLAEEYAKKGRWGIDPKAPWRKKPASAAQKAYAEMCEPGCSRRDPVFVMTAGQASDIITLHKARKRVAKQERKLVTV